MEFLIKRFKYLTNKKNIRFSGKGNGFRGPSSKVNKDDHKGCFNYKKPDSFIAYFSEL